MLSNLCMHELESCFGGLFSLSVCWSLSIRFVFALLLLRLCLQALDGSVFERFRGCLESMGQMTADAAQQTLTDFQVVRAEAAKIERGFNLKCFLQTNSVMTGIVKHVFSPYKEDPVRTPCASYPNFCPGKIVCIAWWSGIQHLLCLLLLPRFGCMHWSFSVATISVWYYVWLAPVTQLYLTDWCMCKL